MFESVGPYYGWGVRKTHLSLSIRHLLYIILRYVVCWVKLISKNKKFELNCHLQLFWWNKFKPIFFKSVKIVWKWSEYIKIDLNCHFNLFLMKNIISCDKNNLLKSQLPFCFSSYCSFVFSIALFKCLRIFSMLLHVSTVYG